MKGRTDRSDDCEIGEVAAAGTRVVTENDITVFQAASQGLDLHRRAQTHPLGSLSS